MGKLSAESVLNRAWAKAQDDGDDGPVRWTQVDAMRWLNDAQRETVMLVPSANPVFTVEIPLAGCRQTADDLGLVDCIQILDISANYASDLTTPGRAITLKDRKHFDESRVRWRTETGTEARHWFFNPAEPKAFDLYPGFGDSALGGIGILYSAVPKELTLITQRISIDDIYANALQNYVLGCFYLQDTAFTAAPTKAQYYMQAFRESLGIKASSVMMQAARAVQDSNAKGAQ